jgi:hypothetical protein
MHYPIPPLMTKRGITRETDLRYYPCRTGSRGSVRNTRACRVSGRACFRPPHQHGSRPDSTASLGYSGGCAGTCGGIIGSMALVRATRGIGNRGRNGAILSLVAGIIALLNGGLDLAVATGGPGSGNGVVGGAAAVVLGVIATALGGLVLSRTRRTALQSRQMM